MARQSVSKCSRCRVNVILGMALVIIGLWFGISEFEYYNIRGSRMTSLVIENVLPAVPMQTFSSHEHQHNVTHKHITSLQIDNDKNDKNTIAIINNNKNLELELELDSLETQNVKIPILPYGNMEELTHPIESFDINNNSINLEYIEHLKTLSNIPKLIHISWFDSNVLEKDKDTETIRNGIGNAVKLNQDWICHIWNDSEILDYIESKLTPFDFHLIKYKHIVEKVDFFRILVLYFEGGYYQDIDRRYNIPFKDIIIENVTKILLPTFDDINFAQDIMGSAKYNLVFKYSIEFNLLQRRIQYYKFKEKNVLNKTSRVYNRTAINYWLHNSFGPSLFDLGPVNYWHGVTKALYGKILAKSVQSRNTLMKMRQQIGNVTMMKTHKETGCDSIVYKPNDMESCASMPKGPLWNSKGKKHWTQEVVQKHI